MIQFYAATNQPPSIQRPALPGTMRAALWAMCAGAAVSAVHAVVYAGTAAAEKAAIAQKYPHLSASDLTTATHVVAIGGSIAGWISAALFLGVARACRQGQDWARVAGSVFFVIGALGLLWNATHAATTLNLALGVAAVAAGLVAVALLWQRSSGRYFESFPPPRS
jgi:hypothetical protein